MPGLYPPGIFVFIVCFLMTAWAQAECLPGTASLKSAQVSVVTDGDSLRLRDGRRVRLLSVNAPELGKDGKADEVHAVMAKQTLAAMLSPGQRVYLQEQGRDRYGRSLATVFLRREGGHLGEALLKAGAAWHIAVPPSPQPYRQCLRAAESEAKSKGLGVWSQASLSTTALTAADQGFRLVRGQLQSIGNSRSALWLRLDGDLVLRLAKSDLRYFSVPLDSYIGHQIEVRGWLRKRTPPRAGMAGFKMDLRHPDMLVCNDCRAH
jgi:micrococcal nuclease